MMYADDQIIQSLPPALQGELKELGPLEAKTADELRQFLLVKREQYHLPPWHAFTRLMQRAALATGESQKVSANNCWYTARAHLRRSDSGFSLHTTDEPAWCYVTLHMKNNKGDTATCKFAVQPTTGRVWKVDSEYAWRQKSVICGNHGHAVHMPIKAVLGIAEKAIREGRNQVEGEYIARPRRVSDTAPAKVVKRSSRSVQKAPNLSAMLEANDHVAQQWVSEVQKEVICTILDLAAVKARELGMHSTIVRWRQTLNNLIVQEVKDAENQS